MSKKAYAKTFSRLKIDELMQKLNTKLISFTPQSRFGGGVC